MANQVSQRRCQNSQDTCKKSHYFSRSHCTTGEKRLIKLRKVPYLNICAVACTIHPGQHDFSFIRCREKGALNRWKGEDLVCQMLRRSLNTLETPSDGVKNTTILVLSRMGVNSFSISKLLRFLGLKGGSYNKLL